MARDFEIQRLTGEELRAVVKALGAPELADAEAGVLVRGSERALGPIEGVVSYPLDARASDERMIDLLMSR